MKKLVIGMLAHVDAGKTTLSEGMLYLSGSIRRLGKVDSGNTFLDTYQMERDRGITIFSKQARLSFGEMEVTLLDTPGHVDFSAEMERTLQVLDYGILLVSGADGIQGHTLTLWKLLARYQIPVFVFVNKMDQEGADQAALLAQLQSGLDERCVDFSQPDDSFYENLAVCDEELLDQYLESGTIGEEEIQRLIAERKVFPCYFGSALKMTGVKEFLEALDGYTKPKCYPEAFGAKVFKISRDAQGNRLTFMKITGGRLKVKDSLEGGGEEPWEEKVNQIRMYSGEKYEAVGEAGAGEVCAVCGLTRTRAGQGLGEEISSLEPVLEPVLSYQILFPEGCRVHDMLPKLQQLEEEEPLLHILWEEQSQKIYAQLMGEVQIDVLKSLISERFDTEVELGQGQIVYRETLLEPVEGVGHFEPLRHYAEVHLLLEPGERGSGMQFGAACSEDVLDRNWQRLILTHLEERSHRGVLTGAPLTDMRITLIGGRAHQKHTEGGDFRQATYRAVRQGMMKARSMLLEPYYEFRLEIPVDVVGRAMSDIQMMSGVFEGPEIQGETAVLTGSAPVSEMGGYPIAVASYSRGLGRIFCTMKGYQPCHNEEAVLASSRYDPELDLEHTGDSVFCSHGAGFTVPWYQVEEYMHVDCSAALPAPEEEEQGGQEERRPWQERSAEAKDSRYPDSYLGGLAMDKELEEIFQRTYKKNQDKPRYQKSGGRRPMPQSSSSLSKRSWEKREPEEEYLLVDGYNIIFSWEELKELSKTTMDGARSRLMEILSNYQGMKQCRVILVFDAYRVEGHRCEILKYHNIYVVYTKEAETADQYIEKTVHELGKKYRVTVATSDGLEQVIILGQGGLRMSAMELKEEIQSASQRLREEYLEKPRRKQNLLFQDVDGETAAFLETVGNEKKEQNR